MPANTTELEKRLWEAADQLRANSELKSHEYSVPVLGLIFLRYADHKFAQAKAKLTIQGHDGARSRRTIGKADYQAQGVLYLPESARFSVLLDLPEGADIAKAINDAMRAIEADNEDLRGVLPKTYSRFEKGLLVSLLKNFAAVPMSIEGDASSAYRGISSNTMKNHTLMQTIARANRVWGEKRNGLIVDYVGVFRNLQKALAI
jgi:type I restriction enzyme M protein